MVNIPRITIVLNSNVTYFGDITEGLAKFEPHPLYLDL